MRTILSAPESQLRFESAKLAFDAIIAPETNTASVTAEIDQLATAASRIAANGSDIDKLKSVRQVIYEAGAWNANRPFIYDHDDPYGELLRTEFIERFPNPQLIPPAMRPRFQLLAGQNAAAFQQAKAWGWTPPAR